MRVTRIPEDELKLAVCISRKTAARAVDRNRLRRVTRAALDGFVPRLKSGHYVALFPRKAFESFPADVRVQFVGDLLRRTGLLVDERGDR